MAPCSSRPTSACHKWHVVAVVVAACLCQACATACPVANFSDKQILITNKYVSYYFSKYSADGEFLTLEGLRKLLGHLDSHHFESNDDNSHITHDHHPEPHSHGSHLDSNNTDDHGNNHDHIQDHNHEYEQNDRSMRNNSSRLTEITADMSNQINNSSHLGHNHDNLQDDHIHHDHIDHDHSHHKENNNYHENHKDEHIHHDHVDHDHNQHKANSSSSLEEHQNEEDDIMEKPSHDEHTDTPSSFDITKHMTPNNAELKRFKCGTLPEYLTEAGLSIEDAVTAGGFIQLCPTLLYHMDVCAHNSYEISGTHQHHGHGHGQDAGKSHGGLKGEKWLGAFISIMVIGLVGLLCIMLIPAFKRSPYYKYINPFLVALAVGTLSGDALIHLLPHAIGMPIPPGSNIHTRHALYGFTALVTIVVALFAERIHNLCGHGGHGHSHGHSQQTAPLAQQEQEDIKDIDTGTVEEEDGVQNLDKIGEKLSKHSKHNSFIYAESSMNTVGHEARDCFVNCPEMAPSSDANGNQGLEGTNSTAPATPEQERLVASLEKMDQELTPKVEIVGSPGSAKRMPRQNSSNFNMMMSEYHVNHHGHSHHGHSHVTGKKASLRYMILMGDAIHTALDGLAIGAAFGSSVTGGVATAIAVLCHELPHKVGDFALLFEMGLRWVGAMKMMGALWLFSVAGMVLGVLLGNIPTAAPWIYSLTAGVFIYLALVDLLAELPMNNGEGLGLALKMMLLQGAGMLVGASIMLAIAIYEHDLQLVLEGKF